MSSKVDPSFKSKRYRDKLRVEVKELEKLLPVDRPTLHRKLDSQAVYRIAIAYLRSQAFIKRYRRTQTEPLTPRHCRPSSSIEDPTQHEVDPSVRKQDVNSSTESWDDLMNSMLKEKLLQGFALVASIDGTIMYVTENVQQHTGFSQVALLHKCLYTIIHSENHSTVKRLFEQDICHRSFYDGDMMRLALFCRMRCFQNNAMGFSTFHCTGKTLVSNDLPRTQKSSSKVVLLLCQPFMLPSNCGDVIENDKTFWTKHDLDLTIKIPDNSQSVLGYSTEDLKGMTLYNAIHPDDTRILEHAHRAILDSTAVQTIFLRLIDANGCIHWNHSKGKVISKNSKKFSIVFTHSPVRDEECVFLRHEEVFRRNRTAGRDSNLHQSLECETFSSPSRHGVLSDELQSRHVHADDLDFPRDCPSAWHVEHERHSPVLPSYNLQSKAVAKSHRQSGGSSCRRSTDDFYRLYSQKPKASYKFMDFQSSNIFPPISNEMPMNVSFNNLEPFAQMTRPSISKRRRFGETQTRLLQTNPMNGLEPTLVSVHRPSFPGLSFLQNAQYPEYFTVPCSQFQSTHTETLPNTCMRMPLQDNDLNYTRNNTFCPDVKFSFVCNGSMDIAGSINGTSRNDHHETRSHGITPVSTVKTESFGHPSCIHIHKSNCLSCNRANLESGTLENLTHRVKYDIEASFHMRIVENKTSVSPLHDASANISNTSMDFF